MLFVIPQWWINPWVHPVSLSLCDVITAYFLFHLFVSSSMIHHTRLIGTSLYVGCPWIIIVVLFELLRKYLSFLHVCCLELFVYFSVTSSSCLVWWHWLQAVFLYLTKQVFAYCSWVLICLAWVAIAGIFSHSAHCFSIPLHPPRLSSTCSQFLFFFSFIISFFSVFGFYSCLLACCLAFNWKLILFTQEDNLSKHCFFSPLVLIPHSQRCRIWLTQSSFQENIPCHNTVYCVYMDSVTL